MAAKRGTFFTHHTFSDREAKNLTIMNTIAHRGRISRTDIAKETGMNLVTVSNYINSFLEKGLVVEESVEASTGGRPPTLVEINAHGGYAIGIDIEPASVTVILTDQNAKPHSRTKLSRSGISNRELVANILNLVNNVIRDTKIGKDKVRGIGMGIPGVIDYVNATVREEDLAPGLGGNECLSIRSEIQDKFGVDTFLESSAACAAFGEKRLNVEADVENLLYVYSDVGWGIMIRGDDYYGVSEKTTEEARGLSYLRPFGAGLGIVSEAKKIIDRGVGTDILRVSQGKLENISLETIVKAREEGDRVANELVRTASVNLGARISYLINLFKPDAVILGGGLEKLQDILLAQVRETVHKLALRELAGKIKVVFSSLGEDAVVRGAACMVLRELFLRA